VAGSQAPVNLHWGEDNRTTGLRVPISAPVARRVENRIAGADANPYLAIAATLAAGLAGMQEELAPTAPITGNASDHGHDLARAFIVAHQQMAASTSAPRLLGAGFVNAYLSVKALEHDSFMREISAWERRFLLPQA
jgi:glutamine synthetase